MKYVHILLIGFLFLSNMCLAQEIISLNATTTSSPPFAFKNKQSEAVGTNVEIIRSVFNNLGYRIHFNFQTWEKSIWEAQNGEFDFVFLTEKTPEREKIFYFSEPTVLLKTFFYKRKDRDISFKFLINSKKLKVGIAYGYKYEKKIQDLIDNKTLNTSFIYGNNIDLQGLLETAFNKIDYYICTTSNCNYLINKYKSHFKELEKLDYIDPQTKHYSELHLAFPKVLKNSQKLCQEFNQEFLKFKESQEYQSILKKYNNNVKF